MLIVDSQIHLWQNGKMSAQHRQIPSFSVDDALAEMASAGVDCAVIHPPSSLGEAVNVLAVEAARRHPDKFCILGHFDLESPDRENIVAHWRERPRSEEHTSELQSLAYLVCRLLLEKKKKE